MRDQVKSLIILGPVWLFQLWLLATFRSKHDAFLHEDFEEAYKERSTKGIRLATLRFKEVNKTSQVIFSETFNVFLNCSVLTPSLAPFSTRRCGPKG